MNEKNDYQAPILTVITFGSDAIMSVSTGGGGIELPDHDWE